jgi:hypothetical protein
MSLLKNHMFRFLDEVKQDEIIRAMQENAISQEFAA